MEAVMMVLPTGTAGCSRLSVQDTAPAINAEAVAAAANLLKIIIIGWLGRLGYFKGSPELLVNDELVLSFTFFDDPPRRLRRNAALLLMIVRIRSFEW